MPELLLVIRPREKDLGGFSVRRLLPFGPHRMVGPFLFFDHMGPAEFAPGKGMDVRPHPHIHLATVTYLFEGAIRHRDSLGSDRWIEPGAINWMTAGRGIVHSERTPKELREKGTKLNGIQLWVALPLEHENTTPTFVHHPAKDFPDLEWGKGLSAKVLLGDVNGHQSPVRVHSDLFYVDLKMETGTQLRFPVSGKEAAFYVAEGEVQCGKEVLGPYAMGVAQPGQDLTVLAKAKSRVLFLGGTNVGKRFMDWNFVSSSSAAIEEAKREWRPGPGSERFPKVPGDDQEFIPLP